MARDELLDPHLGAQDPPVDALNPTPEELPTEPGLRPIRAVLPNLGGIDISPVILIIALMFLDQLIIWLFVSAFG